jgi:8-oxo-dGTP diphosphatase
MGGFVESNETVENAVKRELQEEMGYDLKDTIPRLVGVYSDPRRDNRRRTVSAVFAVHMNEDFQPHAGDDAKEVIKISIDDIEKHTYFSDHRTILLDYRGQIRKESHQVSTEGDFASDIVRSTCSALL